MTFNRSQLQSRRLRPLGLMVLAAAAMGGCLNRPVAQTRPETNNIFVKQNPAGGVDKIDVLFMIDNSLSMGDKQAVLAAAVPQLLKRLTNPDCVADGGGAPTRLADPNTACPDGTQREFAPVKDIHIGVVTSSLGDFGGDTCPENGEPQNAAMNDKAWLLGALPRTQPTLGGNPFLDWTPDNVRNYTTAINEKVTEFGNFVQAATELGCGNEMILEGWYRFLVDTEPPQDVITQNSAANSRTGVDNTLLDLRKKFLRPDSLLAVFMLADENDCSMRDDRYGWVAMTAGGGFRMWRGSNACANNPNDECCFSCMLAKPGLVSDKCLATDTGCRQDGADAKLAVGVDDVNTRCRGMKKRFGEDFLFPASRYVNALTMPEICPDQTYGNLDCSCKEANDKKVPCEIGKRGKVRNPIYMNLDDKYVPTGPERIDSSSVFLAGVVGVPWQDLVENRDPSAVLQYMTATQLAANDRWNLFAPKIDVDYSTAQLGDPLMIESFEPRTGKHPLTQEDLAGPDAGRMANTINGHEWKTANKDVQFACIFSLDVQLNAGAKALRTCDLAQECGTDDGSDKYKVCARRFDGCSCTTYPTTGDGQQNPLDPNVSHSPLCQTANGGYGNMQYYAKAYPGTRQLQVLRGFYESGAGDNAIVGSICPKDLEYNNRESAGYGYNPAVKSLVDRLKDKLGGTCLPRKLKPGEDGSSVPCAIVEAIPPQIKQSKPEWCNCVANGRETVEGDLAGAIRGGLRNQGICDGADQSKCSEFCLCGLRQLKLGTADDASAQKCLNQLNVEKTTDTPGFCYVDPEQGLGDPAVVAACKPSEKRIIRIVGNGNDTQPPYKAAPAPGRVFIACSGSAYEKTTTQ